MGVFTTLGVEEWGALGEAFGLGAIYSHRAIAAGTINTNFDVTTERGRYFVRVNEGKAEVDVAWEARLVTALAGGGLVTPPPLVARDGRPYAPLAGALGKWVSIFPWRLGGHLAAGDVTVDLARAFGATLAELHRIGLELPTAWRRGSIYDHSHLVARYERFADRDDPALADAIATIGDELAYCESSVSQRRRATLGMIHGDLFRDNVLWEDGAITAVLDFEQASGGSLAYDLAVAINDWCWTDGPRIDRAAAMIAGYQSVRPLTEADRVALPVELRAAAMRFTITRITDVYLARVANPDKDFRAFLARMHAWRGQALGELSAAV